MKDEKRSINESKVPIVQRPDGYEISVKRFVSSIIITFLTLFLLLGLFSYISNFWGFFGSRGAWALYNDRQAKVDFLRKINKTNLPEAYILGSSDMYPFQPKQLEDALDLKTFNLANYWGRIEDMWGWLNFLIYDLKAPPKLLVVGLEPWTFSSDTSGPAFMKSYTRRFIATQDLVKYTPDFNLWKWKLSKFIDLFSVNNIRLGAIHIKQGMLLKISERPSLEEAGVLEIDGTNIGYNKPKPKIQKTLRGFFPPEVNEYYRENIAGIINDPEQIKIKRKQIVSKNYIDKSTILARLPKDVMDDEDINLFKKFVKLCKKYDTQLIIIFPPVHPLQRDHFIEDTNYINHIERISELVEMLEKSYMNIRVVFDATDLKFFGGDPREFHDINHMTPVNTKLIMRKALERFR